MRIRLKAWATLQEIMKQLSHYLLAITDPSELTKGAVYI